MPSLKWQLKNAAIHVSYLVGQYRQGFCAAVQETGGSVRSGRCLKTAGEVRRSTRFSIFESFLLIISYTRQMIIIVGAILR